jgi:hypothetical protein
MHQLKEVISMLVASIILPPIVTMIEDREREAAVSLPVCRKDTRCLHTRGGFALTRFI